MKAQLLSEFTSRQHMVVNDFELYYFEDIGLKQVSYHSHTHYELYFFLEGEVEYIIGEKTFPLAAGDILIIPPGLPHYPLFKDKEKAYRRFVLWIEPDILKKLFSEAVDLSYMFLLSEMKEKYLLRFSDISNKGIQARLIQLIEESRDNRFCCQLEKYALLSSLLVQLNRLLYEQNEQIPGNQQKELYLNLCSYINNHLTEALSLETLASAFFVSKYHISHVFKENMGISVYQYILGKRLLLAKNYMLSGIPINQVASLSGFHDYSSFFRAFKKEYGMSPKKYLELKIIHK